MKFSKYFMLAGATLLLAACSSDEPVVTQPDGYPMTADVAENDSYALISLEMPAQPGTRAAQATTTDVPAENQVVNGAIVLFEKATGETEFTYVGKYDIATSWEADSRKDINRKTYVQVGFPKGTFVTDNSYKALVVLNYPTNYPFPKAPVAASEGVEAKKGQTYTSWATSTSDVSFRVEVGSNTYLTMVSAAKYENKDKMPVLVDLNPANMSKDLNKLDPSKAAAFYVHRVAAKISVAGDEDLKYTIAQGEHKNATVELLAWDVDMAATECYPVQNVTGLDLTANHMHTTLGTGDFGSFQRCSWGKGAFYDATTVTRGTELTKLTALPDSWKEYEYVKENTMPAKQQIKSRTTRVVIKAQYTEAGAAAPTTLVKVGNLSTTYMTKADFLALIKAKAEVEFAKTNLTVTAKQTSFNGGYYSLTSFCEIKDGSTVLSTANTLNEIAKDLGLTSATANEIALYQDGICYYAVMIRHFDNSEVPLDKDVNVGSDYEDKHLGRYGVLRNNWYEVKVTDVTKIGRPEIPTPNNDADDKEEDEVDGMSFNIYMLNWAKRSQNATL